jgi:hypothetical protein
MDYEIEFKKMEKRFSEIEERIGDIGNSVKEIRDALLGTELSGNEGWIFKLKEMEKTVTELKDFRKKIIYTCMAIGAVFAVIEVLIQVWFNIKK